MTAFFRIIVLCALMVFFVGKAVFSTETAAGETAAFVGPVQTEAAAEPASPQVGDADLKFPVARTIGGMGLVLFLMIGGFFAARKFAPRYFNKPVSQKNLKIVETLGMGDRRSISLIEVGSSRFLIGNTPQQISMLAALPESISILSQPEQEVPLPEKPQAKKGAAAPFRSLFEVEKSRSPAKAAASPLPDDLRVKMRQLREALERP